LGSASKNTTKKINENAREGGTFSLSSNWTRNNIALVLINNIRQGTIRFDKDIAYDITMMW